MASTSELSFTSGNEAVLPTIACDTDLASRCDCIIAWPVAPTWVEPPRAAKNEYSARPIRPIRPRASSASRIRCCSATGRAPISGRLATSGAAPLSAPCRRVSVKSAISEGTASEMIDPLAGARPAVPGSASNAAAASMSTSGRARSGGAIAGLPPWLGSK